MDYWPTLSLIQHILHDHQAGGDDPQLIACMHPDISQEVELLGSAVSRYAGQLFYLSAEDSEWVDPPGPISEARRDIVIGIISSIADAFPGIPDVQLVDGRVVADVAARGNQPIEPSLRPILRAVAVISSAALETLEITVIAASLVDADERRRELLWRLLTPQPDYLGLTGHKTIVSVLSGKTDPDRDYARATHVKYVAREDRILKRASNETPALRTLKKEQGPIVLFLGAGASASAGMSLGDTYRTIALRDLLGEANTTLGLEERFFQYLQDGNDRFIGDERAQRATFLQNLTLERVLRETFHELGERTRAQTTIISTIANDSEKALQFQTRGRTALQQLIKDYPGRLIVMTVNFDQLIEAGVETETLVVRTPEEFKAGHASIKAYVEGDQTRPVPILKLHGSIESPDTLIATIDSTATGLHADIRAVLDTIVHTTDQPTPWVWVGCSMRDLDVNDWVRGLADNDLDQWWADPFPGASLDRFIADSRLATAWTKDGRLAQRQIIDSADRFLVHLRDSLLD